MKKNKRQRLRLKPVASAQREAASVQPQGTGLRWTVWLGGLGLVFLTGYFVLHQASVPVEPRSALAAPTNSATLARKEQPRTNGGVGALAGTTNRPGAVKNRETEGHTDDLNNMGVELLDEGNAHRAIPILQHAVALKPDDETFHFNLAVAYMRIADSTNAEHEYKEALRLLPDYPEAHNNYGNLLAQAGRLAEAEEQLKEAVKGTPESAAFNNNLGVLRQRLNKTNEALLCFQKAVQCDTNFAEAHFNLAQAYLARREREKGIAELLEVLRIKPDFAPAKRALARVTPAP
jgi:Tfp pilus assembly protein PilF